MYQPLADKIRPQTLDDVVGQRALLGEGGILRRIIDSGQIPNMIFYGPSGIGKTTVASIIARQTQRRLYRINATTASIQDIRAVMDELDTFLTPNGALVYLDEIQYFNKKQQQSLLECIESGKITLIASTTENPYFYIYGAVLSRCTVFEFKPVEPEELCRAVERAFRLALEGRAVTVAEGTVRAIASGCGGDVRKALNAVELLAGGAADGGTVTPEDAQAVAQRSNMRFDRDGDAHYDILSAFHKSIRGSDPDAAVHYLARLLEGGDMQSAARRLLVIAAEDVGLAYPQAMPVVKACVDAAFQLGLPEARLPLAEAALLLATAPKSDSAAAAIAAAAADLQGEIGDVPSSLRDAHYAGASRLGRGKGYLFPHDYPSHWVEQQYLPDALDGRRYYEFGENKNEQAAKKYWETVKNR